MQTCSHSTRAFIYNAKGLKGFLIRLDLVQLLKDAYEAGELQDALSYQSEDIQSILTEL